MPKATSLAAQTRRSTKKASATKHFRHRPATLEPLSEEELTELGRLLARSGFGSAMDVEELDGFFVALLVGPPVAKPCHYWPVVLGENVADPCTLDYIRTTTALLPLFARHWYTIAQTLDRGNVHLPYLNDKPGTTSGRIWARGFLRAVELQIDGWQPLIASDEHAAALIPMMILAYEDDSNSQLQAPRQSAEKRNELIRLMVVGVLRAYRYFAQRRPAITPLTDARLN